MVWSPFFSGLFSISGSFLLLAWVIKITLLLPGFSLISSLNLYFYTLPLHCISSQKKRPFSVVSCPSLSLAVFTRIESTFSINTSNYLWKLPIWTDLISLTCSTKKKFSSHSPISFRMSSLLRFPLGFRTYQEISA